METPSVTPAALAALKTLLETPKRCVITTHFNPDGDAMGSSLAWAGLLRTAGHTATVVLPNTPPGNLQWMPGYANAVRGDEHRTVAEQALAGAEVVFCLDFNKQDRVGPLEEALKAAPLKVMVDHHREPDDFARIAFSHIGSCATAQMIFDLAMAMGWSNAVDADVATNLLTGLITDSGSFRFSSTTPHTLRVAAELMAKGAVPDRIHAAVLDDNSADRMRLLGFTLSERMEVLPEQEAVVMHLSAADLERFAFKPGDTEGFVNMGLSIRGIRVAAILIEKGDTVKISMRSKGDRHVNGFLARHYSGGGHANAAGGKTNGPLVEARKLFVERLPELIAPTP